MRRIKQHRGFANPVLFQELSSLRALRPPHSMIAMKDNRAPERPRNTKVTGDRMKNRALGSGLMLIVMAATLAISGCKSDKVNAAAEAPPSAKVVTGVDVTFFAVEHPELYPIVTATEHQAPSQLFVTGTVFPDIARTVPVISLASGRIVDIRARLGDAVKKGQVLLRIRSDDISGGFDAYHKAISDELLSRKQLDRAKQLYEHGAIAQQDLEVAQDTEDDAKTTLDTATEHLRLLGTVNLE